VPDHGDLETKELHVAMKAYSPEFKADAVALYLSDPSRTYASVAKDLGVNRETLRLWVRETRSTGTAGHKATPAKKQPARPLTSDDVLEEENKQLRTRIRELELERDILRRAAKYFAVNVLREGQDDLSARLSKSSPDKWRSIDYEVWETGCPILPSALAIFECRKLYTYDGGDHAIFVGEVLKFDHDPKGKPLVFYRGAYHRTVG